MTFDPSDAKSIFLKASDLAGPERAEFLDQVCQGQPELRARVENLLTSFDHPGSFLEKPVDDVFGATWLAQKSGEGSKSPGTMSGVSEADLSFLEPCDVPGRLGRLGPYEVTDVIGRGGMGIVLKAFDTKLHRIVAIKVLSPQLAMTSMAVKRFLREAQAAAAVSHDHVITIFAVEEHDSSPYLVMECIVGQSLQDKIDRSSPLRLQEILRIGMQIAAGLAAAHKQGLVHRDVKPSNILLENGVERVKITDFGLARAVDDVGMTQTGQIAGTPQYMSPEQAMGERVDARSDLFSLGSVLYTMCTGRPAFRADSAVAVLRRVCDDEPRSIREINPEIPEWMVSVIQKLLAKKPQDRFQTSGEVAELLSQCLAWVQQPDGPRPTAIPNVSRRRRRIRWQALWMIPLLLAVSLGVWGMFQPTPRLIFENQAQVVIDVINSKTPIKFVGNQGQVMTLAGPGKHKMPAGIYRFTVEDTPGFVVTNVRARRTSPWTVTWETTSTTTTGIWRLQRGDQLHVRVLLDRIPLTGPEEHTSPASPENDPANVPLPTAVMENQAGTASLQMLAAPFTAEQARAQQREWSRYLEVPEQHMDSLGISFRLLTPARFNMGNSFDEVTHLLEDLKQKNADEYTKFAVQSSAPKHRVQLEAPFYIAQYEVTVAQFRTFVDETGYSSTLENLQPPRFQWPQFSAGDPEKLPVCGVSWDDAKAFCEWLSRREGVHYDLPTEAQWEYACRAGDEGRWCFGNNSAQLDRYAVYDQRESPGPSAIGTREPNAFGLYDMHGNVEEWCFDWHLVDFYKTSPEANPVSNGRPTDPAAGRVTRGGSWNSPAWKTRSAIRMYDFPSIPAFARGFRPVITGDLKPVVKPSEGTDPIQESQPSAER